MDTSRNLQESGRELNMKKLSLSSMRVKEHELQLQKKRILGQTNQSPDINPGEVLRNDV